jgi:hypothetical protein
MVATGIHVISVSCLLACRHAQFCTQAMRLLDRCVFSCTEQFFSLRSSCTRRFLFWNTIGVTVYSGYFWSYCSLRMYGWNDFACWNDAHEFWTGEWWIAVRKRIALVRTTMGGQIFLWQYICLNRFFPPVAIVLDSQCQTQSGRHYIPQVWSIQHENCGTCVYITIMNFLMSFSLCAQFRFLVTVHPWYGMVGQGLFVFHGTSIFH